MASHAFHYSDTLISQTCIKCGVKFAFPEELDSKLRENHETFYCPNGHPQMYTGKTEAQKLRDELAREKQRREMAEATAREEAKRAEKAERAHDRTKKRVHNGVCPCCNRTFQNLARHMATKHPEHK